MTLSFVTSPQALSDAARRPPQARQALAGPIRWHGVLHRNCRDCADIALIVRAALRDSPRSPPAYAERLISHGVRSQLCQFMSGARRYQRISFATVTRSSSASAMMHAYARDLYRV